MPFKLKKKTIVVKDGIETIQWRSTFLKSHERKQLEHLVQEINQLVPIRGEQIEVRVEEFELEPLIAEESAEVTEETTEA